MKRALLLFFTLGITVCTAQTGIKHPGYRKIKTELLKGWGQYNTMNILSYTHLPDGFDLELDFRVSAGNYASSFMGSVLDFHQTSPLPVIRPVASDVAPYYSKVVLSWEGLEATIEAASIENDLVLLIGPVTGASERIRLCVSSGMLWNRPQNLIPVYATDTPVKDFNFNKNTPYLVFNFDKEQGFSTGHRRSLGEIKSVMATRQAAHETKSKSYGQELYDSYQAISAANNFNTFYEPQKDRLITSGSRYWNVNRGGYAIFGWDPIFQSYIHMLTGNKDMAYANIIEGLDELTPGGFVPNVSQGSGRKALDRSQPPVGSMIVKEIYKKYNEKWFLEAIFDDLLSWNRWWMKDRLYHGLLCWGSKKAPNPYNDLYLNTQRGASLESGMDDSPMYEPEECHFNAETGLLELHDVGLNSLYIADCAALSEIAKTIGRNKEADELDRRAKTFRKAMQSLWSEKDGIFLNRRTDNGQFSKVLTPTLFYPLIAKAASPKQAQRMIKEHLENPKEFAIEWMLPSVSANHPEYVKEAYWKGAVWSPLNFLVYWGLRNYDAVEIRKKLAQKSQTLLDKEWLRKAYVPENWSSISGAADDHKLISTRFYGWGGLIGTLRFIEKDFLPAPEKQISR